jgi:hypothetical protein
MEKGKAFYFQEIQCAIAKIEWFSKFIRGLCEYLGSGVQEYFNF